MYWAADSTSSELKAATFYRSGAVSQPYVAGLDGCAFGASYGYTPEVGIASVAEYVERRHFQTRVPRGREKALPRLCKDVPSLEEAFAQTRMSGSSSENVCLPSLQVFRCADWTTVDVPRCLIALDRGTSAEQSLNPYTDSSGAAAHVTVGPAIDGALMEFVERQVWTAFWLGGAEAVEIAPEVIESTPCFGRVNGIDGQFIFYQLNAGLPAYTVVCLYHAPEASGRACFACGVATALSPRVALNKATVEAVHYLDFVVEKNVALCTDPALGRLERNALRFQSADALAFLASRLPRPGRIGAKDFLSLEGQLLSTLKHVLKDISRDVFAYVALDSSSLGEFAVAKVFSPDFYLHCDPGVSLNFSNAYARHLGIANPDPRLRTSTCLP